jgi:asparagine synthase (glutamine-hydrolysing)
MFSFAIWDRELRTLFCARDRLGIKPFYYWTDGLQFIFGSEIKALLMHPAVSAEFDAAQLPEYLAFGYLSGEETMFRNIRKLMPGHTMKVEVTRREHSLSHRSSIGMCRRRRRVAKKTTKLGLKNAGGGWKKPSRCA